MSTLYIRLCGTVSVLLDVDGALVLSSRVLENENSNARTSISTRTIHLVYMPGILGYIGARPPAAIRFVVRSGPGPCSLSYSTMSALNASYQLTLPKMYEAGLGGAFEGVGNGLGPSYIHTGRRSPEPN